MQTHFGAFADLSRHFHQNSKKVLLKVFTTLHILRQKFMHWLYCFLEHRQSIHPILPAVSLDSYLCVTFNYVTRH